IAPSIVINATLSAAVALAHSSTIVSPANTRLIVRLDTESNYHFRARKQGRDSPMDPYAGPNERKVGAHRPKSVHRPPAMDTRTRKERQAEKETVAAERRAIKKSARRHLKQQLSSELEENI